MLWLHATVHEFCLPMGTDHVFSAWSLLSAHLLLKVVFTVSDRGLPFLTQPPSVAPNMNEASLSHHFGHYSCRIVPPHLT